MRNSFSSKALRPIRSKGIVYPFWHLLGIDSRRSLSYLLAIFILFLFPLNALSLDRDSKDRLQYFTKNNYFDISIEDRLEIIKEDISRGYKTTPLRDLLSIVKDNPASPLLDEVYYLIADIYISDEKWRKAANILQKILERFPATSRRFSVEYKLALCQFNLSDHKASSLLIQSLLNNPSLSPELRQMALNLRDKLRGELPVNSPDSLFETDGYVMKRRRSAGIPVGVILPLSGKYADFGEAALKGILNGAEVFGHLTDGFLPLEIIVKDSKGDPSESVEAVKKLATQDGVVAILGPLLHNTSFAAARTAQGLDIPLITFSQASGVTDIGNYIFRNSITPNMQAKALAEYAVYDLGISRFAILYPETSYGRSLAASFKGEVEKLGGEVVKTEDYSKTVADFSGKIRSIFSIRDAGPDDIVDTQNGKDKFIVPTVDFEALFIPDYYDKVSLIAPQLAFYNVSGIQLLGGNGWDSKRLIDMGERYVNGSIFVDGFFVSSPEQEVKDFVSDFKRYFDIEPGILEAQAYDTVKMIMTLIRDEGIRERDALRDGLERIYYAKGVTGETFFDDKGEPVKDLYILKVENGKIISLRDNTEIP